MAEAYFVDKLLSAADAFTGTATFASGAVFSTVPRPVSLRSAFLFSLAVALSLVTAAASAMFLAALLGALLAPPFSRGASAAAECCDGVAPAGALILGSSASGPVSAIIGEEDVMNCFDALAGAADLIFDGCRVFLTDLICAPLSRSALETEQTTTTNRGIRH
ncbi:hypothetical protein [Methylocella silvestris]|uniref:hypothetical protein n=1 Tax=Methylocella silvestris TaxID=199596 RepID=UPI001FE20FAD|nr:hypothetical protein [Methylocella silvestris]